VDCCKCTTKAFTVQCLYLVTAFAVQAVRFRSCKWRVPLRNDQRRYRTTSSLQMGQSRTNDGRQSSYNMEERCV